MTTAMPTAVLRALSAILLLSLTLSGCGILDIFEKSKKPLPGERVSVFTNRGQLEPDKDMAGVEVVLPAPVVNDSWPQSGGFANYAMQHLSVGASPQVI